LKKAFFILTLIIAVKASVAQRDTTFKLIKTFPGQIADAAIDNLDYVYVLTETDQLKKYNATGDSIAVYNNVRRFGKVYSIDVSNPLKVLLYYKDFASIVILDRLLAVRTTLDLRRKNILQVAAMGQSYDNNIWVFDAFDNKLKKIDDEGNVLLETPDFRQALGQAITPQQIIDQNKQVFLYDPANGLYVFDRYGTFQRRIPVQGWSNVSITDKFILGISDAGLQSYNISSLLQSQQKFPGSFTPYYRYFISNNKLIAVSKDAMHIYRY
jgi:hypothetical protein